MNIEVITDIVMCMIVREWHNMPQKKDRNSPQRDSVMKMNSLPSITSSLDKTEASGKPLSHFQQGLEESEGNSNEQ